ncbi:MAG: thioredoxin domain-containing protein [Bacteroidetes bacterium]|nr:thioredoxin domain-containing protein [Bacteroidota bacterium]
MKKLIPLILIFTIILFADGISQNRSIAFSDKPFADILAMAKKENKLIFMDAYASWCGPCKWMSANIFTNDTVADFYNKNFICAKYDIEKGEGVKLAQQYQVRAYPTLLFINSEGRMVHIKVGAVQTVPDFIKLAGKAMDPNECFATYEKRYSQGENNPVFIYNYLKVLSDAYRPVDVPLIKYLSAQKESDLVNNANWKIVFSFCNNMDSKEFNFMLTHRQEFVKAHGKDSVNAKFYNVFFKAIMDLGRSGMMNDSSYSRLKRKIYASGYTGAGKVIFDADLNISQMQGNLKKLMDLAYQELNKYYNDDPDMLNELAGMMLSLSKDNNYLEKASQWAKRSVELKPDVANNETCAALLYSLGKRDDAVKYCKNALVLARKQNVSTETIEQNLKKYGSGQ